MSAGEFSVRLPGYWTGLEGKIAEIWQLSDVWGLMRQVGAAPAPGQAG
jgi:hypothetical protein